MSKLPEATDKNSMSCDQCATLSNRQLTIDIKRLRHVLAIAAFETCFEDISQSYLFVFGTNCDYQVQRFCYFNSNVAIEQLRNKLTDDHIDKPEIVRSQ